MTELSSAHPSPSPESLDSALDYEGDSLPSVRVPVIIGRITLPPSDEEYFEEEFCTDAD